MQSQIRNTPDRKKLRRKTLLNVVATPLTVVPFLAGMTAFVASWASGVRTDLGIFAAIAGLLGSVGVFFTRLLLGGDTYAKRALEELQEETHAKRERALDNLEARLVADGDPRTESALRDLRSLARAFERLRETGALKLNIASALDITSGVAELFEQCVNSLEQTLRMWHTAQEMRTDAAREPILKHREAMLTDVTNSIARLGHVLAAVQTLGSGDGTSSELARIGEELDQHLAVAKQVEERIKTFERQLQSDGCE